jgi:hypothetical protein
MKIQSPEAFNEDFFLHNVNPDYNPAQAHEYYLRNRQLKGRPTAAPKPIPATHTPAAKVVARPKLKAKVKAVPTKSPAQKHKEIEARVHALQGRLEKLKKVLAILVKQAKARSGVHAKPAAKKATAGAGGHATSKLTAKQKADKAKASKAYYEKHKNDATAANVSDLEAKIHDVSIKIAKMRAELAAAKKQVQNHKPVPVGAGSKTH